LIFTALLDRFRVSRNAEWSNSGEFFEDEMLARIRENFQDVRAFGLSFLKRHLPRLTGADTACISIKPVGSIYVRTGESDVAAVRQVFRDGSYRVDFKSPIGIRIWDRYNEILASGSVPIIVDAGANIGAATMFFRSQFPRAHIVSIEPEIGNFSILTKNAGCQEQTHLIHAAVGSTGGFVSVKNEGLGWAARTERASSGVPVITMKSAFDHVPNGAPFIAKIDIEGFEADLFSANIEWLDETFVVYIEPHDWMLPGKSTSRTFQRAMGERDYEIFIGGETLTYVRSTPVGLSRLSVDIGLGSPWK
jgi:FkbM family methyltransferase